MQISANRGSMICIRKSQQQDPLVRNGFGVVLLLFVCFFFVFSLPGNQGRTENTGFYRVFFFFGFNFDKSVGLSYGLGWD